MYYSSKAMVSPGSYTEVVVLGISHTLQPTGEFVNLTSTSPAGINVTFIPKSPVALSPSQASLNVTLFIQASANAAVGNGTITVHGVAGPYSQSSSFTLKVVQYRIVMLHNTFIPSKLNVTVGSTIYWQNLDGPAGGCGAPSTGSGLHSVVFTTIPGANSSGISQFGIYSYTFNTAGSYFYYSSLDSDHAMNGTINVVATGGGGMGMVSRMPSFSSFRGGGGAAPAATPIPTASAASPEHTTYHAAASPIAALGLALAGLFALGVVSSTVAVHGLEPGLAVLISLLSLALVSLLTPQGRKKTAALGAAVGLKISPSDSHRLS